MYEQFYGLDARPFDLTPDPRYLVLTKVHQEALSNLEYAVASRKGVTLLLGEAGTGKTTIIRAAISRQPKRIHCVHLPNPALSRVEFMRMLAAQFSLSGRAQTSRTDLLLELEQLLRRRHATQETTVLIIDEAQSLLPELLEEVRLLTNIETDDEKLLSLVLLGQPELATRLNEHSLRQLKQRIALRCDLRPLQASESVAYVANRITRAGGVPAQLFTREAVVLLHEYARGIPRTINVIADNALLGGFAAGQRMVTSQIVADVCRDFDIPRPAPASAKSRPVQPLRSSDPLTASEPRIPDAGAPATFDRHDGEMVSTGDKIANWTAPMFSALGFRKR
jgi:general secretion pathway protein A